MKAGERFYRILVHLYPKRFCARFEAELLHLYDEDKRQNDVRWMRLAFDALISPLAEHLAEFRRGRARAHQHFTTAATEQSHAGESMLSVLMHAPSLRDSRPASSACVYGGRGVHTRPRYRGQHGHSSPSSMAC
jgi:hypothetical protein